MKKLAGIFLASAFIFTLAMGIPSVGFADNVDGLVGGDCKGDSDNICADSEGHDLCWHRHKDKPNILSAKCKRVPGTKGEKKECQCNLTYEPKSEDPKADNVDALVVL